MPEYRQDLAESHNSLGALLDTAGRLKEAEGEYRAALGVRDRRAEEANARG